MLQNQVAIVTGASRGLGQAIAMELAEKGAKVVVNYAGSQQRAEQVVQDIKDIGGDALAVQADVADADEVKSLIKQTIEAFGRVDILVNNAGITRDNLLIRMKEDDWDAVINTNLKGVFNCAKTVARQMMKQRYGRIINVSSVVAVMGNPGQANYVAAKAGVIGLTKSMAKELANRNIHVNAIAPGFIESDMTEVLTEEVKDQYLTQIPLGSFGSAKQVASVVRFLASSDADYMTGQTLHVDGGLVMP
ncbi:3-oxoacyl-[acyl-carrier-protein] reductase [Alkalicoccobacillus murimartini]|uniref:3-oxoacyl-[acyl-carrier-protein] reductase n=1 Tax=Alkalicoccobacillus murimartini TaxID=171685 RepID=A0ABT9YEX3_9BACI|nr:3-oxoacyl-[acyl-carrier-protein] reductase [Alkalicoccobacillus murimartini]MDQ0206392.1 3-oxoacyl-[acyl-carrier protein] reductase [Alkalicoccobacillus murimartini]